MEFKQGYASRVMKHFDFVKRNGLEPYTDTTRPLIVFGVYKPEDLAVIEHHKSKVMVRWCGLDSRKVTPQTAKILTRPNVEHISPHPKVIAHLSTFGIKVKERRLSVGKRVPEPRILGDKIYTYTLKNKKKYGSHIVDKINTPYEIMRATTIEMPLNEWNAGGCEKYYSKAFIGLALSNYAAGAGGIIQMGLRGIPVVTNVFDMPHTIPWETVEDIEKAIMKAAQNIGKHSGELAEKVAQWLNNQSS